MSKILIVDDSMVARMALKSCIPAGAGHEVVEVRDGESGVGMFETLRPDVTFLDLTMPGIGGKEALQRMLAIDPAARIVVLTADIQRKTIESVVSLGAFATVRKPPVKENIVEVLEKALSAGGA